MHLLTGACLWELSDVFNLQKGYFFHFFPTDLSLDSISEQR